MKKNIAMIILITIFTKGMGFVREIALTYFYGATAVSDVYLIAQTIPSTLFALIGTGLATTFIPIFNRVQKEEGDKSALRFSSNVISLVMVFCTVLVFLVLLFTPQVVKLFASGFQGDTLRLAISFTRISVFGIYFTALIYILNAYLQLKNEFTIPALVSLPMNLVLILFYGAASKFGDVLLAYGIFFSILIQFLFILPSVIKNRFRYRAVLERKNVYVRDLLILALPVVLGTSVNQLNVLVDKNIASSIVEGGISALNYADRLSGLVYGLFVIPVVTVIYPSISRMAVDRNQEGMGRVVNESIVAMSLLILPASVGAMVLARPIIEFLFMRGEFDTSAAILTSEALYYYSFSMLAYGFRDVLTRVFYSNNDSKTPTTNAMIGVLLNIVLNIVLSRFMGIGGLALATSISAIITAFLLAFSLHRKNFALGLKKSMNKIIRILLASLLMGGIAHTAHWILIEKTGSTWALLGAIFFAAVFYAGIIWLMKIEEVETMVTMMKSKWMKLRKAGKK